MRNVSLYVAASLDGCIARPDGAIDWLPQNPEDYGYRSFIREVDTLLMGRKTYDQVQGFGAWPYEGIRSFVYSRTRAGQRDERAEFVDGDIATHVTSLKREAGRKIWLVGGAEIIAPCLAGDVVDEIILSIPPLLLGEGIPLFLPIARSTPLRLRELKRFDDGLVQLVYDVAR